MAGVITDAELLPRRRRSSRGSIVTSIVAFILWVLVIVAGVHSAARKADQEINHSVQASQENPNSKSSGHKSR
jgi:hypothetical protein